MLAVIAPIKGWRVQIADPIRQFHCPDLVRLLPDAGEAVDHLFRFANDRFVLGECLHAVCNRLPKLRMQLRVGVGRVFEHVVQDSAMQRQVRFHAGRLRERGEYFKHDAADVIDVFDLLALIGAAIFLAVVQAGGELPSILQGVDGPRSGVHLHSVFDQIKFTISNRNILFITQFSNISHDIASISGFRVRFPSHQIHTIRQIFHIFAQSVFAMKIEMSMLRTLLGKSLLIGFMLALSVIALPAQSDLLLEHFSISKNDGRVLLNWVTRPGSTCDGVDVMRSTDSISFETIYHIPGICGGPNSALSYSYLDEHPVANYRNFYRLGLGSSGTTSVRAIEVVDLGNSGHQVRPNPVVATSKIYFDNGGRGVCQLTLVSQAGVVVGQWETREEFFEVQATDFEPGMYFLRIQDADGKALAKGRLVVVH